MTRPTDTDIALPEPVAEAEPQPATPGQTMRDRAHGLLNLADELSKLTSISKRDALTQQYVTESAEVITQLLEVILQQATIIDDSLTDIIGVVNQHGRLINAMDKRIPAEPKSRIITPF